MTNWIELLDLPRIAPRTEALQVLVVESDARRALDLVAQVEEHGNEVLNIVGTPASAYKLLGRKRPDLVILGAALRGRDDIHALGRSILDEFGIPVISGASSTDLSDALLAPSV